VERKRIESKSQHIIEVFDNAQLGGERDVLEQLQLGQIQMSYLSPVLGNVDPKINILDLPYLFKDYKHLDSVLDGDLGKEIIKDLPSKGIHGFAFMENGFREITNSKKPINTLDDLKGLKIRVPEAPISIANLKSLGTNVVTLAFPEVYSALQQGTVDGQENAYAVATSSKFYEVQKYVAETKHMWGSFVIVGSEKWYSKLSPDLQKVIQEAADETSKYERQIFREEEQKNKQELIDKGMKVTTPDLEPFRQATTPVYEDFFKKNPNLKDLVNKIRGN
jgi:tripartite ATP-independent transporter DctP family solute receptor